MNSNISDSKKKRTKISNDDEVDLTHFTGIIGHLRAQEQEESRKICLQRSLDFRNEDFRRRLSHQN